MGSVSGAVTHAWDRLGAWVLTEAGGVVTTGKLTETDFLPTRHSDWRHLLGTRSGVLQYQTDCGWRSGNSCGVAYIRTGVVDRVLVEVGRLGSVYVWSVSNGMPHGPCAAWDYDARGSLNAAFLWSEDRARLHGLWQMWDIKANRYDSCQYELGRPLPGTERMESISPSDAAP